MNLMAACNAPPDSNLRIIAKAYMGSPESGYSIAYWSRPTEFQLLTRSSIRILDHTIDKQDGVWKVVSPSPPPGASGEVVSICGEDPALWDAARCMRTIAELLHGGFVFASGWTKWGNITGPLSKQERSRNMQNSKHSRPGPHTGKLHSSLSSLHGRKKRTATSSMPRGRAG